MLAPTKEKVLAKAASLPAGEDEAIRETKLCLAAGHGRKFYNLSKFTFPALLNDPDNLAANLTSYIAQFSPGAREIFVDRFKFGDVIQRLNEANLLFLVMTRFLDEKKELHPDNTSDLEMGYIFEELIRRFSEQSNETAGEHFTPREVIGLMVRLLFAEDEEVRTRPAIRTLYDPACGTGGMLSVAQSYLREVNPKATLKVFGQELNPESFAICKSDLLIKNQDASNIKFGNSFSQDGLPNERFDYLLSNPPFGVDWKKVETAVREEHELKGMQGRFGAGLPRVSDGSLLFLQHMISKFKPEGSRLAIVLNGSPLFTGSAGSGESEIRRWIIENDWLEAIIALPEQLFYNTGIGTYIWIVTNRKPAARRGKVQLVNATDLFVKMKRSLGDKRNEISPKQIQEIVEVLLGFHENGRSKIFDNEDFGYQRITIERPLRQNFAATPDRVGRVRSAKAFVDLAKPARNRTAAEGEFLQESILRALSELEDGELCKDRGDFTERLKKAFRSRGVSVPAAVFKAVLSALAERDETAEPCLDAEGNPEPDPELRDYENVPLKEDAAEFFEREVRPHVPEAWVDWSKTRVGYEIPFTRHFYEYKPPRPLEEIENEIVALESEIQKLLPEVLRWSSAQ